MAHIVPDHLGEVRDRRLAWVGRTRAAVKDRLTKEITYWDHRAAELHLEEQAGRPNARLNSQEARRRADELQARLEKRLGELNREAQISPQPPVVIGGVLVAPLGLLDLMAGKAPPEPTAEVDKLAAAAAARAAVMRTERSLGFEPRDREAEKVGYDIESRDPRGGALRFIEVKGRAADAETVTVTRNEILYFFNKPEQFILAIVEFLPGGEERVHYVRRPFHREPDLGAASVNYGFAELLAKAERPG